MNRDHFQKEQGEQELSVWRQRGPLALLTGIFFLNFISRVILAPLMPSIEKDLEISHAGAGSLFLLISSGYFISLAGAGFLSSQITHRRTIIVSAAVLGITLAGISLSHSLWAMRLGLFMLGMAAGIYLPSGIAMLTSLISPKHWGKGLAVHELAPNLGFVAAPLMSEALLTWFSWRAILALLGGVCVLAGIAFSRSAKGGDFPGEAPGLASFREFLVMPAFWIMTLLFSLGISGSLGVYTMLPLYLVAERGMERGWANSLVALSRLSGLAMAFLAGWAADRFGGKRTMAGVLLLTGVMTVLLGVVPDDWIVIIIFMQAMLAVCFFPPGFAALSGIGRQRARNVVVSLTIPVAFLLGGGVIPAVIGILGDAGSFSSGMAIVGALIITGFLISLYLRMPADGKS